MYDLTRINEEFQKFLKSSFKDSFNPDDMEVTEALFKKANSVFIPFGTMRCRLIVMNGNPVFRIRLRSRMDLDWVVYIDDESIRFRDLWDEKMGNMDDGCNLCGKMDERYFRCPVCGRRIMPQNYLSKFKRMEAKYGTHNLLEISKEKLTFEEVATIYTFIEISDRHCDDNPTYQRCRKDGTFKNLIKRQHEITDEFYFGDCSKHVMI